MVLVLKNLQDRNDQLDTLLAVLIQVRKNNLLCKQMEQMKKRDNKIQLDKLLEKSFQLDNMNQEDKKIQLNFQ